jgi:glycine/D-amino acid oxidase-like deaminating enzyme
MDYQVAIIGAGIVGASIAARLCSAGVSVVLIDKGSSGAGGASGLSGGLVRLYDPDPLLMALAALSIGAMDQGIFASTYACALRRTGVLYRTGPEQLDNVKDAIEHYASAHYPMRLVANQELNGVHFPRCADGERTHLFEAHACVGNVRLAASLLTDSVRQSGLLLEHCEVKAIDCRSRHEARIELGEATLRCRAVVVAAGAWSRRLLPTVGLHTRSIPLARVLSSSDCGLPIIDSQAQAYAIPLSRQVLQTGCGYRASGMFPEDLGAVDDRNGRDAQQRIAQLTGASHNAVLDVLPGFDSYSDDGRPLLGFCDDSSPVYLATGMSGVGFKLAPGVAQIAFEQLHRHLLEKGADSAWSALSPRRVGVQP